MLQVYDRVLTSRSEETLLSLTLLMAAMFACVGILDYARSRVMSLCGARFQHGIERRVLSAALRRVAASPDDVPAATAQRDLESIRRLLASQGLLAIFDLPWVVFFAGAIFMFHPWLGWLATAGAMTMIGLTLVHERLTKRLLSKQNMLNLHAEKAGFALKSDQETLWALGMVDAVLERWLNSRTDELRSVSQLAAIMGLSGAVFRSFRLFLQSTILGLGALLVLQDELSASTIVAASILLGRVMSPIETTLGQWPVVQRAWEGWRRLATLLGAEPPEPKKAALPPPRGCLEVSRLTVALTGRPEPVLRDIAFRAGPGQAIGVIGPSGAGKSTLARALVGACAAAKGGLRLDGAALDQFDRESLGRYFGYLPQRAALFDGTIAENIARMSPAPDADAVVAAASKAGAHQLILKLPAGYNTQVSAPGTGQLSGGQIQMIALARALYGDPPILVLDEPNANLDLEGALALNHAIKTLKKAGRTIVIMTHRPSALQECDQLLVLEDGRLKASGPRDAVLRAMVRDATSIRDATVSDLAS
jgi:ATP-binding cassette subfamily C protein